MTRETQDTDGLLQQDGQNNTPRHRPGGRE